MNSHRTPWSFICPVVIMTGIVFILVTYGTLRSRLSVYPYPPKEDDAQPEWTEKPQTVAGNRKTKIKGQSLTLEQLGVLASKNATGWFSKTCDPIRKLRHVSFSTAVGNLSFYIYNSAIEDDTFTKQALSGWYFERREMAQFINLSRDLPLIDIGGNLGLVTLQAALQGRQVVAVEPIPENAIRLCRSVTDFGHSSLVHVIQNAASSREGRVTLAMDRPRGRARYGVAWSTEKFRYGATVVYSIRLDSLLDLLPFRRAALKMDVESHEGHVLAGGHRFFHAMDIPMLWMEWENVRTRPDYGAAYILQFMDRHHLEPFHLMTGHRLSWGDFLHWPPTVLWRKVKQAKHAETVQDW